MTSVDRYQASTETLAAAAQSQALAVYTAYQAGRLTRDQAVTLIAAAVNQSNAAAVSLADAGVSVQIEHATGQPTPATGIFPTDDADRLEKAVHTIFDEDQPAAGEAAPEGEQPPPPDTQMRIERLAHAEPLEAAQNATVDAIQQQPLVEGWTRQMDADPCQLCRWWWREGRIWPKDHPFQSHKGCNCTPKVVLAENIESTMYTRRLERERAAARTD
jgi:hypothetical protein